MPEAAKSESPAGSTARPMDPGRRRRSSYHNARGRSHSLTSSRLRALYFSMAALWGYLLGVALFLVGAGQQGNRPVLDSRMLTFLVPGAVVAILGAVVASRAYYTMRSRRH